MCDTCGCNITLANESLIHPGGKLEQHPVTTGRHHHHHDHGHGGDKHL